MPKGKLIRLKGLREAILQILEKHDHPTTNKIHKIICDRCFNVSWITVKKYLMELETEGQVSKKVFGNELKMCVWGIPK